MTSTFCIIVAIVIFVFEVARYSLKIIPLVGGMYRNDWRNFDGHKEMLEEADKILISFLKMIPIPSFLLLVGLLLQMKGL